MSFERLLGPNGKLPVLIRDDDTNFLQKKTCVHEDYHIIVI